MLADILDAQYHTRFDKRQLWFFKVALTVRCLIWHCVGFPLKLKKVTCLIQEEYHHTMVIKEWRDVARVVLWRTTWRHSIRMRGKILQCSLIHIWSFIWQTNVSQINSHIHISVDIVSICPVQYINMYLFWLITHFISPIYLCKIVFSLNNMRQVQPETLPKNSNFSSCLQNIKLKNNTT